MITSQEKTASERGIRKSTQSYDQAFGGYGSFREVGLEIMDSEDIADAVLRTFLSLSVDGWEVVNASGKTGLEAIGNLYARGLWLPCEKRLTFAGQIDARNDGYPEYGAVPIFGDNEQVPHFASVRRLQRSNRGWAPLPGCSAVYEASWFLPKKVETREDRRMETATCGLSVYRSDMCVCSDKVLACRRMDRENGFNLKYAALMAYDAASVLSIVGDFKHLWNVETHERPIGSFSTVVTPLRLGVSAEMVKSLFYARSLPMTESGRRRPILHWVRSHARRLRDGIELDIPKHLRGIEDFEMDGFRFHITQPRKQ